jgi:hypothetical protein
MDNATGLFIKNQTVQLLGGNKMIKKTKRDLIREKDTEEYASMVTRTLDDMFDGSVDFHLNKPLQLVSFNCLVTKVQTDERRQKYRLLILRAMAILLEGAIKNITTFKPEHVLPKNGSIN